jgi:hypothetical protein
MDSTREELIELIEQSYYCDIVSLAEDLVSKGVTVQEWISVNDRLPDLHTVDYEYLDGSRTHFEISCDQWVIDKDYYQTKARYENGVVFQGWVGELGETIQNVTHWMPLPQPPKGE